MPKRQLSLESLHEFDGGAFGRAFDRRLRAVVDDCRDRPGVDKPRKVVLELTIIPDKESLGDVIASAKCKEAIPETSSRSHSCNAFPGGRADFNGESPANANQQQMPFVVGYESGGDA